MEGEASEMPEFNRRLHRNMPALPGDLRRSRSSGLKARTEAFQARVARKAARIRE